MKTPTAARGKNERIYFDSEAKDLLTSLTVTSGIPKSNVVCALIRAASGGAPRPGEESVFTLIKRAVAREHFMSFLTAVRNVIPKDAKPIFDAGPKVDHAPDQWVIGSSGIFAFFAPNEKNLGEVFTRASLLKSAYCLERVFVVTTNVDQVNAGARADMDKANITMVSLSEFPALLKRRKL